MRREDEYMASYQYMMSADDVAKELDCSKSYAYDYFLLGTL